LISIYGLEGVSVKPTDLFRDLFYIHSPRTWTVPAFPDLEFFAPLDKKGGIYEYDVCTSFGKLSTVSVAYRGRVSTEDENFEPSFLRTLADAVVAAFDSDGQHELTDLISADIRELGRISFIWTALAEKPPSSSSRAFQELLRCEHCRPGECNSSPPGVLQLELTFGLQLTFVMTLRTRVHSVHRTAHLQL
jgi:hypothetical protein